jgi:hypothetical protein
MNLRVAPSARTAHSLISPSARRALVGQRCGARRSARAQCRSNRWCWLATPPAAGSASIAARCALANTRSSPMALCAIATRNVRASSCASSGKLVVAPLCVATATIGHSRSFLAGTWCSLPIGQASRAGDFSAISPAMRLKFAPAPHKCAA